MDARTVTGGHQITVHTDNLLQDVIACESDYDMVVLPGGYDAVQHLSACKPLISLLQRFDMQKKWVAAMCAAPAVLEKAGIIQGRAYTAYPGYEKKIRAGMFSEDLVVQEANIITSRGPASVYAFSYALIAALGGDSKAIKERMLYSHAFQEGKDE